MPDRPVMLVTGASRGIGAAIARAAAPVYDVVVNYGSSDALADALVADLRDHGCDATAIQADMGDGAAVVRMFEAVDARYGRLDVLVNNAAIAGGYGTIDVVDAPMLERLWAVNVTGPFIACREAATRMRTDRGGRGGSIVNISSKAAVLGGSGEWVHYAASKGAVETLTVGLAKELAAVGVRVNGVRPGLIASDFHDHAPAGRLERMAPLIPMQRAGSVEEVARAVLFLAGPESSYVTASFIDVAGGR